MDGSCWRYLRFVGSALMVTWAWGLFLPTEALAQAAGDAGPCQPEALFLGKGQRDFLGPTEGAGHDNVPDFVFALNLCESGPIDLLELIAADGTVLWDNRADNKIPDVLAAVRDRPYAPIEWKDYAHAPFNPGLKFVLYASGETTQAQAFAAKPGGKVVLHYLRKRMESAPIRPAPSPLPATLATLRDDTSGDLDAILRNIGSQDLSLKYEATAQLARAVRPLDPRRTLPLLERLAREDKNQFVQSAVIQALTDLGPRALPSAPMLVAPFPSDDPHLEERRRALFSMGPEALALMLATKDPLLLTCEEVVAQQAFLLQAAKHPAVRKAAWKTLQHGLEGPRAVAGALLAWAGERDERVRRELKLGHLGCTREEPRALFLQLLAAFEPTDPKQSLVIALLTQEEGGPPLAEPVAEYRKGVWQPVVGEPRAGPAQWPRWKDKKWVKPFQAQAQPTRVKFACYQSAWGYPGKGPMDGLAFSRSVDLYPVSEPAPDTLAPIFQLRRDAHPALQPKALRTVASQALKNRAYDSEACSGRDTWKVGKPKVSTLCSAELPGGERLCQSLLRHTVQGKPVAELGVTAESCTWQCTSTVWLRASGGEGQIVGVHAKCDDLQALREEPEYVEGWGPRESSVMRLDGVLSILTEGMGPEGSTWFDVETVTPEGLQPATHGVLHMRCE